MNIRDDILLEILTTFLQFVEISIVLKIIFAALLNLSLLAVAWSQSSKAEDKAASLPLAMPAGMEEVQLPDGLTKLQEKYIALQEQIVALRQHKLSLGKGDAKSVDAAKLGLLQSKLGIETDQSKKIEFLQEIVKIRSESHARSQRKQKNGSGSEDDTLMQEVQLIAAQMELLKADKKQLPTSLKQDKASTSK